MGEHASRGDNHVADQINGMVQRVAQAMAQMGVQPLPRNYEMFYEAMTARASGLSRDLSALGHAPAQKALDELGRRRKLPGHVALGLDQAQRHAARTIGDVSATIEATKQATDAAAEQLDGFIARLDADPVMAMSDFAQDAAALRQMLERLRKQEERFAAALLGAVAALGDAQAGIETDQRAALRDGLTGLPNRTALAGKIAALFDGEDASPQAALVLVVVERLKTVAERYGAEIGEKAVRKSAAIFRKSVKKSDVVARVGFDEFAFLLHDVNEQTAQTVATRIRDAVQSLQIRLPNRDFTAETLSLSAGISTTASVNGPQDLTRQAEMALSVVRADGRQGILRCTPMMCAQISSINPLRASL